MLLPREKGRRCDFCHSLAPQDHGRLQRCTRCASYWYCDAKCQSLHWRTHKKYCKHVNAFCVSRQFDQLESHSKLDALLLTHVLAELSARRTETKEGDDLDVLMFVSLLPGPVEGIDAPPTCPLSTSHRPVQTASELFVRCGNNNFSIHSHLTTIAHGVFPLASRLFNHSCVPNAVAKYRIAHAKEAVIEIVALRDIVPGEEICIPYVDPALVETRQQMFRFTYGFACSCPSCAAFKRIDTSQPAPDKAGLESLGTSLRKFVFQDPRPDITRLPSSPVNLETVPVEISPIFRESCLTSLCESFSAFSHDGPFESALEVGLTILAFYVVIYPPNYPQIGMHLLEMAKTAWNAFITMEGAETQLSGLELLLQVRAYLGLSQQIWVVIGPEGDEGGPLAEIQVLERLLSEL
ncbi:hypothetical protein L210DRAFT_3568075 [Boletus edulis BED1]|uniref:SET domain-containing protein n=1 Tax=Boletus edulis BED1 TaxID=1328754 RepID=A0AAD4BER8_BOLED|nr:hypothetical protein L210DRAFT_3568075 [Boletus edulis BED1]